MMRFAGKIIEEDLSPSGPEIKKTKGPKYAEQRCQVLDPNAYAAPINRIRCPRETRNRRPEGWKECQLVLPAVTWARDLDVVLQVRDGRGQFGCFHESQVS
jgi:hypothetical protein